jgi:hypothetical protein
MEEIFLTTNTIVRGEPGIYMVNIYEKCLSIYGVASVGPLPYGIPVSAVLMLMT